ncbi:hypothetical protein ACHAW5_004093 [Stephanodiscus triporus]|uniref:FAS1 domain-containing protein n=1 Tax=Stephanodiscus triporus TaxID=2934178 RepID=A0ABD3NQQ0_9STRA
MQSHALTNEAFTALPEGTVESLLLPKKIELQDILKYHIVAGLYPSSDIQTGDIYTLNGDSVLITVSDLGILVNDAKIITADIMASNGVIHIIDKVLLPPVDNVTGEQANAMAKELADVKAAQTTEASVEVVIPKTIWLS